MEVNQLDNLVCKSVKVGDPTVFILFANTTKGKCDGQISEQLQSFPSSQQDTLPTFYVHICAIAHRRGLVYTTAKGCGKKKGPSCLCLHLNF